MLLLLFNVESETPVEPPRFNGGFEMRSVYRKPILDRILEERQRKMPVVPPKVKQKTKRIEVEAAKQALTGNEEAFNRLMQKWERQIPEGFELDIMRLFYAQVGFRIRQFRKQEEEAILVLML